MSDGETAEQGLVEQAISALRALLGDGWEVARRPGTGEDYRLNADADAAWEILPPDKARHVDVFVSARRTVTPSVVERDFAPLRNFLAHTNNAPTMLVVAPWLSSRTQDLLRARGINYLDLTGNAWLSVGVPSIRIYTHGLKKVPKAQDARPKAVTLAGSRAGRIVRFLADFKPPYQAKQIADATGVSLTWVSRLLSQLEDQLLIGRAGGRSITSVDWKGLLQARAETFDLLRLNPYEGMVALNGVEPVLRHLQVASGSEPGKPRIAVTGPYAARAVAPLTHGGQLMLYVETGPRTPDTWGEELGLLPVEQGGDVLLLRAHDPVVFTRTRQVSGVAHVALSQLVLDGLAGPGRMPAEAGAVLKYMEDNVDVWRHSWHGDPDTTSRS